MNKNITQKGKTQITLCTLLWYTIHLHAVEHCAAWFSTALKIMRKYNKKEVQHDFQLTDTSDATSKDKEKLNKARLLKRIPPQRVGIIKIKTVRQCRCLKHMCAWKEHLDREALSNYYRAHQRTQVINMLPTQDKTRYESVKRMVPVQNEKVTQQKYVCAVLYTKVPVSASRVKCQRCWIYYTIYAQ